MDELFAGFRREKRSGWTWFLCRDSVLDPWFEHYEELERTPVKQNPVRKVFRTADRTGAELYVKHDVPHGFWANLKGAIRPKGLSEFKSFLALRNLGIPCAQYAAYGFRRRESMLVTESLRNSVSCSEFWHARAAGNPELAGKFLRSVCLLVQKLLSDGVSHPDFHAGNLLVNLETLQCCLIDLYGVKVHGRPCTAAEQDRLLRVFWEFSARFSPADVLDIFRMCGFSLPEKECFLRWENLVRKEQQRIERDWPRRRMQILSGNSKFCRTVRNESGKTLVFRNTAWFAPCGYDLQKLRRAELDHAEAVRIWLESFHCQLRQEAVKELPLVWETGACGRDALYF